MTILISWDMPQSLRVFCEILYLLIRLALNFSLVILLMRCDVGYVLLLEEGKDPSTSGGAHHWKYCQGLPPKKYSRGNPLTLSFQIGHSYYRQTVGIPQGSVLSALLCSFFYGDLEKRFEQFRNDLQSVSVFYLQLALPDSASKILLRLIDDYLFITTSLSRAKRFLSMMNQGVLAKTYPIC